ncbi:hypothetical protein D3C71_1392710 [compost metagenome]
MIVIRYGEQFAAVLGLFAVGNVDRGYRTVNRGDQRIVRDHLFVDRSDAVLLVGNVLLRIFNRCLGCIHLILGGLVQRLHLVVLLLVAQCLLQILQIRLCLLQLVLMVGRSEGQQHIAFLHDISFGYLDLIHFAGFLGAYRLAVDGGDGARSAHADDNISFGHRCRIEPGGSGFIVLLRPEHIAQYSRNREQRDTGSQNDSFLLHFLASTLL